MKKQTNKKAIFILILIFSLSAISDCKFKEKKQEEKEKYEKFDDSYKDNEYINHKLNFKMTFDDDWAITNRYEQFNNYQKSYAKYFSSVIGEVLFIGYNNDKKMGVRVTCEVLNMSNEEYLDNINSSMTEYLSKYQMKFLKNEEVLLKSVKVRHVVTYVEINFNNKFIFDSILFKLDKNNIKIDVWIDEISYDNEKDYIMSIYDNIYIMDEVK